MVIGEVILTSIVDAVISYAFEKGADSVSDRVRKQLSGDPIKKAFCASLKEAFEQLEKKHPTWVTSDFDANFRVV